jgi:hypothetical protein
MMMMLTSSSSGRGRLKERWINCVRQDTREMAVSDEMTSDTGVWREKICRADPK